MYPAVGVHHIAWDVINNAVDGVPNVLLGGHQQTGSHQDHEGGLETGFTLVDLCIMYLVVKAKDVVVNADAV